jgi:hypothetical protein
MLVKQVDDNLSPSKKQTTTQKTMTMLDSNFKKVPWNIHPTVLTFLTAMTVSQGKKKTTLGAFHNSFFGVFLLFSAKFTLQSSFFSDARLFTRPLVSFFLPDLLCRLSRKLIIHNRIPIMDKTGVFIIYNRLKRAPICPPFFRSPPFFYIFRVGLCII